MASLEEIRKGRLKKLERLQKAGVNPYPAKVPRDCDIAQFRRDFEENEKIGKELSLAGRIMAIRGQGAIIFAVLFDGTLKTQAIFKKDGMEEKDFDLFVETVDIGDFISVSGIPGKSKTGEESLFVKEWTMATKSLLPLPEKWHGLIDTDERYRKRYLDFLMNEELRDLISKKAKFWEVSRDFFKDRFS